MLNPISIEMRFAIITLWAVSFLSVWRLLEYIRTVHPPTWARLGRLSLLNTPTRPDKWSVYIANSKFVFWGSEYTELKDPRLTKQIWLVRAESVCWFALLITDMLINVKGGR